MSEKGIGNNGTLLFNGQSIEKALNDLLFSKSEAQVYEPKRKVQLSSTEKKIKRLSYLMRRTKNSRIWRKLGWRINSLSDTREEVAG
jgi:hypothetical protein